MEILCISLNFLHLYAESVFFWRRIRLLSRSAHAGSFRDLEAGSEKLPHICGDFRGRMRNAFL